MFLFPSLHEFGEREKKKKLNEKWKNLMFYKESEKLMGQNIKYQWERKRKQKHEQIKHFNKNT